MIRVRFAPSPTGNVHIGSLRTALYNYIFAKKNDGKFLLRLEDTDQSRYEEGAVENLLSALSITGLKPDEGLIVNNGVISQDGPFGPYIQSKRLDIYNEYIKELLEKGHAYYCFCSKDRLDQLRITQKDQGQTPRYDGYCRHLDPNEIKKRIQAGDPYTIRLKLPIDQNIVFNDLVRGQITVNSNDLDDQVLIKTDGFPTYHFAVVIDDHLMKISHIIRGEEWLPSTPKHIYLYDCFGWEKPEFVHLPNILNDDHKKLSKRQGDVSVGDFLSKGYLPQALINFLALLGWSPKDDKEIFTLEELIENFNFDRINKSGAVFDRNKLNWMNAHYIKQLPLAELVENLIPYLVEANYLKVTEVAEKKEWLEKVGELLRDRLDYFGQAPQELKDILDDGFCIEDDQALSLLKDESASRLFLALVKKITASNKLDQTTAKTILKEIQKEEKIKGKALYMPTRIMITGEMHGPDLTILMDLLGKEDVLKRLDSVKNLI